MCDTTTRIGTIWLAHFRVDAVMDERHVSPSGHRLRNTGRIGPAMVLHEPPLPRPACRLWKRSQVGGNAAIMPERRECRGKRTVRPMRAREGVGREPRGEALVRIGVVVEFCELNSNYYSAAMGGDGERQ